MKAAHLIAAAGLAGSAARAAAQPATSGDRAISKTPIVSVMAATARRRSGSYKAAGVSLGTGHAQGDLTPPVISVRTTPTESQRRAQKARSSSGASTNASPSKRAVKRDERFHQNATCAETGTYDEQLDRCARQHDLNATNDLQGALAAKDKCQQDYERLLGTYINTRDVLCFSAAVNMFTSAAIAAPLVAGCVIKRRARARARAVA